MLSGLEAYRSHDKKYNVVFEGDDQLRQLNDSIKELSDENLELRRRIAALKKDKDSQ